MKINKVLFCFVILLIVLSIILFVKINAMNTEIASLLSDVDAKAVFILNNESLIKDVKDEVSNLEVQISDLTEKNSELISEIEVKENTISELFEYANMEVIRENHEILESSWECKNGRTMMYALYVPNGLDINEPHPLILFLHGSGEIGTNLRQLERCYNGFTTYVYDGRLLPNAYILMPQSPDGWWDKHTEDLMGLILETCDNYNIDMNRISITGHSLGGFGTLSMLYEYPEFFSAAAPLSSSADVQKCKELTNVPVWFFVGAGDGPYSYQQACDAINENGGTSYITVYEGEGHSIPYHYLDNNCEIVNWLITQSR